MNRYIKVDDIIIIKGIPHVVKEVKPGTTTVESVIRGRQLMYSNQNLFEYLPDYREMYEQEKQRADELEEKLNKEVEESYQMENRWRTEIERADVAEKLIKRAIEIGELRLNDLSNGVTSIGFGERKGIEQVLSALKNSNEVKSR